MTFEKVITKDGTVTYYNEECREHYHTLAGALDEAKYKHLKPAEKYIKDNSIIIDYCFGLGYNSIATLAYAKKNNIKNITIIAFENDINIIKQLENFNLDEEHNYWKKAFIKLIKDNNKIIKKDKNNKYFFYYEIEVDGYKLILYLGDARDLIKEDLADKKADVLYFDPFSKGKVPEMWTDEVFESVYRVMNKNSIVTTYSCARPVRNSMSKAGFIVIDGPVFGRKAPGTLAIKK